MEKEGDGPEPWGLPDGEGCPEGTMQGSPARWGFGLETGGLPAKLSAQGRSSPQ